MNKIFFILLFFFTFGSGINLNAQSFSSILTFNFYGAEYELYKGWLCVVRYSNGNIKSTGTLKTKKRFFRKNLILRKHGTWLNFDENGELQSIDHFEYGKKEGLMFDIHKRKSHIDITIYDEYEQQDSAIIIDNTHIKFK